MHIGSKAVAVLTGVHPRLQHCSFVKAHLSVHFSPSHAPTKMLQDSRASVERGLGVPCAALREEILKLHEFKEI